MSKKYQFEGFQAVLILGTIIIPWAIGVVDIFGMVMNIIVK